ncbi:hypothetical protein L6R29_18855 [Myxococcota bacterium]|nr:hypothetical protein [Myxococcota bacterium]
MMDVFLPRHKGWFVSFGVCVVVLWAACTPSTEPLPCDTSDDCPNAQRCQQRKCIARVRCSLASAALVCLPSEACVDGFCRPNSTPQGKCTVNQDCEQPKICDTAAQRCVRCLRDDDCPISERCNLANLCTPKNTESTAESVPDGEAIPESTGKCASDVDCKDKPNHYCDLIAQICKVRTGSSCQSDKNCPSKQHCVNNACTLGWRSCSASPTACEAEFECRNNLCYPKVCQTDEDCEPGRPCNQQFGLCQAGQDCTVAGCPSDAQCNATTKQCEPKPADCTTTGCPTDQQCNATTKKCEPKQAGCTQNTECSPPKGSCRQGQCQTCASEFTCSSGQTCDAASGRCQTAQATCAKDADCTPPAGACSNSRCVSCASSSLDCTNLGKQCDLVSGRCVGGTCTDNTGCLSTQFCKSGGCVAKECDPAIGLACAAGETCTNFECTGGGPRTCTSDSDCKNTQYCKSGTCTTKECSATQTCPSGQTCQDSRCVASQTKKQCTTNTTCGAGSTCVGDDPNVSYGHCYRTCTTPDTQGICKAGEICAQITATLTLCLPIGTKPTGATCGIVDNRCDLNNVCFFASDTATTGLCYKRCTTVGSATGCPSSTSCETIGVSNACVPPPTQNYLGTCAGITKRCKSPNICVYTSSTASSGTCYKPCTKNSDCSGLGLYDTCQSLQNGGGFCYL